MLLQLVERERGNSFCCEFH